ncbi:MAG: pyridoxamine 5'-phosphate oxidase [Lacunisphaera sp.]
MSDLLPTVVDPIAQFTDWLEAARGADQPEPTAMSLATAGADGTPAVRIVLLKGVDERGFVFYTNLSSPKAADMAINPKAALCFHWPRLKRQVRISGGVIRVTDAEADAYFATRPRLSQIGAWASQQSQPMWDRFALERKCALLAVRFGFGAVPRPPGWSGYRVVPEMMEFWCEKPSRLHDRVRFSRSEGRWSGQRIFP